MSGVTDLLLFFLDFLCCFLTSSSSESLLNRSLKLSSLLLLCKTMRLEWYESVGWVGPRVHEMNPKLLFHKFTAMDWTIRHNKKVRVNFCYPGTFSARGHFQNGRQNDILYHIMNDCLQPLFEVKCTEGSDSPSTVNLVGSAFQNGCQVSFNVINDVFIATV